MIARNPYWFSAHGACSREDPQPKFLPVMRIVAPRVLRLVQFKVGIFCLAVVVVAPVEKQKLAEARALNPLQELLRNDLIRVHVHPV